jgi:hypothetical protein
MWLPSIYLAKFFSVIWNSSEIKEEKSNKSVVCRGVFYDETCPVCPCVRLSRGIPYLSLGEFPSLMDFRGIPRESIENSFLFQGSFFFAKKVELLRNSLGIPCGPKVEVHKWDLIWHTTRTIWERLEKQLGNF